MTLAILEIGPMDATLQAQKLKKALNVAKSAGICIWLGLQCSVHPLLRRRWVPLHDARQLRILQIPHDTLGLSRVEERNAPDTLSRDIAGNEQEIQNEKQTFIQNKVSQVLTPVIYSVIY